MTKFCNFYSRWAISCRPLKISGHFSEGKPICLLSLPTINFADRVFSDLSAIYLVIISPSPGKRKEDFLLLSPPGAFHAALPAAALLHSVRGCQAQTMLSGSLRDVKEPEEDEVEGEAGAAGLGYCAGGSRRGERRLRQRLRREPGAPAGHSRRPCLAET